MEPGKVSIITLNWDHYNDLTGPYVTDISAWTPDPKELIVVDQGSRAADVEALSVDAKVFPWLKVFLLDKNIGFPGGCNFGAKQATGEWIVWMNNDIRIRGDWLSPLLEVARENPRSIVGTSLIPGDTGWNAWDVAGQHITIPYLEGWLLLVHRSFLDEVGYFDEVFGTGSLEDVDLCWRAANAGYQLLEVPNLPLTHLRGRTVMDGRLDTWKVSLENLEILKRKVAESLK